MKKLLLIVLTGLFGSIAAACPVCEKQQAEILGGFTHGAGPESRWDYLIVSVAVIIVAVTLFYSLKWLFRPGERSQSHIKHFILDIDKYGR